MKLKCNFPELAKIYLSLFYFEVANCIKKIKEKDLTLLHIYDQVLDLASKDVHHHTVSIPPNEKKKRRKYSNKLSLKCNTPNSHHTI